MAQITLNSSGVASSGSLVLQSNGTTTAATFDTAQKLTLPNDAVVSGLTVGKGAGAVSTNTAVGASALQANSTGASNTVTGYQAAYSMTGNWAAAYGRQAMYSNTSGEFNISFGGQSLYSNTTGSNNTALGHTALYSNTTASNNTAVGYQAAYANTTGQENTAIGQVSLTANTTGSYNTAVGRTALYSNTTASYNTSVGQGSLQNNTTASNNTAVGYQAGYSNTTGLYNNFFGYKAGYSVVGSNEVNAFGYQTLWQATGAGNTAFGSYAGGSQTTGTNNCYIGYNAGYAITTGSKNTILGAYTGNQGGLDIRTSSNYIVLSDGDGNPRIITDGSGRTGFNGLIPYASYNLSIPVTPAGNAGVRFQASTTGTSYAMEFYTSDNASHGYISYTTSGTSYNTTSDYRLKHDINPMTGALAKVAALKPCTYKWNADGSEGEGFIAHELAEVCPHAVTGEKDAVNDDGSIKPQGIDTSFLVATLTAAIQELKAEFDAYKEAHP